MITIVGMPCSGVNLLMNLISKIFGDERILGYKYPMQYHWNEYLKKQENETEEMFMYRLYVFADQHSDPDGELEEIIDFAKNGFWESVFFRGIFYRPNAPEVKKILSEDSAIPYFCKVSPGGLYLSNPNFVNKVIVMVRDPREISKAKGRVLEKITALKKSSMLAREAYKTELAFTAESYCHEFFQMAMWLNEYPKVPVMYCSFNDLVTKSKETLKTIAEFIGEGKSFSAASSIVKSSRRNCDKEVSADFADAVLTWELITTGNNNEIVKYFNDPARVARRISSRWLCMRTKMPSTEKQCKQCKSDSYFRSKMREYAEKNGVEWRNQPCAYECVYSGDKHVSIDDSISNNFWNDGPVLSVVKDTVLVTE